MSPTAMERDAACDTTVVGILPRMTTSCTQFLAPHVFPPCQPPSTRHGTATAHVVLHEFSHLLRHFIRRDMAAAWDALLSTQSTGVALLAAAQSRDQVFTMMRSYFERVGLDVSSLEGRIVHIAGMWPDMGTWPNHELGLTGTKGKGSTSAMCESILRNHGLTTGNR